MGPTQDLQDALRVAVTAVLALATGYHLARLVRRPVATAQAPAIDAAHALMGGVMLLMLAGWVGRDAGLGWAAVFGLLGILGVFSRSRVELVIGSAAMVLMLAAASTPAAATTDVAAGTDMAGMPGMPGMDMGGPATGSPGGTLVRALVVLMVLALLALTAAGLLRALRRRTDPGAGHPSGVAVACRVGMNLAAVYMLVLMV